MKKTLLIAFIAVVLGIAGGAYYILTNLNGLVKQAIEKYGSEAVHTAVRVKGVDIQLKQASAAISGLSIANPAGFSTGQAFSLKQISTRLDIKHIDKQHIAIDEVRINSPEVFYEVNARRESNLLVLKKNLGVGSQGSPQAAAPGTNDKSQPIISIQRFTFEGGAMHILLVPLNNKQYTLKLPGFSLNKLQGTPQQISKQILDQLITRVREELRKQGVDAALDKSRADVKAKLDAKKSEIKQKADSQLQDEKTKAQDKLKKLFGQ